MADRPIYDEPSDAKAEQKAVHVQGPATVEVSMTPKAALETARRLEDAAIDALLQNPDGPKPPDDETADPPK